MNETRFLAGADGGAIAYRARPGAGATVVFLPGFNSDMAGAKAEHLDGVCARWGCGFVRFDYSGHGQSAGVFAEGTIGRWRDDALAVIDAVTEGPLVLVGSSMGGWIALLAALARPGRVAGIVGLAAAPDFTEDLMWEAMLPAERAALMAAGRIELPSEYGAPVTITRALIEDGRAHLLLRGPIGFSGPVRLLHGQADADVPWERSLTLARRLAGDDVRVVLIKDAGHRLSRPGDLAALEMVLGELLGLLGKDGA